MRDLTQNEIEGLASRPGVRRIAVENFLGTMGESRRDAEGNLSLDGRSYQWNAATMQAIRDGIRKASL